MLTGQWQLWTPSGEFSELGFAEFVELETTLLVSVAFKISKRCQLLLLLRKKALISNYEVMVVIGTIQYSRENPP